MSSHPVRQLEITSERRVRRLGQLAACWAGVPLVVAALAMLLVDPSLRAAVGALAFFLASVGLVLTLLLPPVIAMLARRRIDGPLRLATSRDALAFVGREGPVCFTLPWSELGVAWLREPRIVEIATACGDEADLVFASPDAAAQAVASLRRRDHDRRAYPIALEADLVRVWRQSLAWYVPCAMAMVLLVTGPALWPAAPIALVLGWLGARGTRRLRFGADGVLIEGRFRRRHVPYRDIAGIETKTTLFGSRAVRLRMANGTLVTVGKLGARRAVLVEALLEEGLRMVQRGEAAGASAAVLSQEGRETEAWIESLRTATHERGYRGASLDADRLLSIVRNPAAEGAQRVAAALALRADPSGPRRIRVAAGVSTEPDVRDALDALGAEAVDEDRVERALRRLTLAR